MVDCRSLIEFCRAFEQHRAAAPSPDHHHRSAAASDAAKRSKSLNPLSHPFCEHSPFAAIDVVILLLVLGAIAVLTAPYFSLILHEASDLLPSILGLLAGAVRHACVAYFAAVALLLASAVAAYEIVSHQARKCGNPYCKGLRKAVEFDIQLESEECLKYLPPVPAEMMGVPALELGEDREELEAELKKMAPMNGRTVLIFRSRCGCAAGRLEVWGAKKIRRIKK